MIERLDPKQFDARIDEVAQKQRLAKEAAKEAIAAREEADRMMMLASQSSPVTEIPTTIKATHAELLKRALRNLARRDSKVVWTILHKDIYESMLDILNCNDLGVISEAAYLIYDKLPPVTSIDTEHEYFYEVDHGEYLGADSWSALVQSQILHNQGDGKWIGVPIVQNNRYKTIKSYNLHMRVTAYIMHCTVNIPS